MSLRTIRLWVVSCLLALVTTIAVFHSFPAMAQEGTVDRKIKSRVSPVYPEIARRMAITGKVKLAVVIAPNGSVKEAKVVGGHPVLVNAAMDAVRKWKYEPGPNESSGTVEFTFTSQE